MCNDFTNNPKIIKRDGRKVDFDPGKITAAINKAFIANDIKDNWMASQLTISVLNRIQKGLMELNRRDIHVEEIQDIVEAVLIDNGYVDIAVSYKLYRKQRSDIREGRSTIMNAVAEIIQDGSRDNANVGNSPSAKLLQIAELASKEYYLKRLIPTNQSELHQEGYIHIHDLGWYGKTLTCLQIPLGRLLSNGFDNGKGYIRRPKGIKSAAALAAIIIQSNQNDMHGGQSFGYFDRDLSTYMEAEYIKQEKLLKRIMKKIDIDLRQYSGRTVDELIYDLVLEETNQAMEGFVYNLNTMHSRAGAQVPFSSINLGTDTSRGGRLVTECFLKAYERGLGKGETPWWPNICFKVKDGINSKPGDPNYDLFKLAMQVASKRLQPTFSFQDSSFNKQFADEEVAYMGCRTRVIANVNGPSTTDGRGNLSFTTINLPRLGMESNKDLSRFWELLDNMLEVTIQQLLTRYNIQKNLRVKDFPFLMGQKLYQNSEHLNENDRIEDAIKNGTLSVGFVGLAECLSALTSYHHGESLESQQLGLSIIDHMREKCDLATEKYNLNFTLLATPAESVAGRFLTSDAKKYGIIEGITDKEWYTNSFHIPVEYKISAFDKIAIEGAYHKYCNAGHITYVELPSSPNHNIEAYEAIIQAMKESDIGYGAVNFPVDTCKDCGFTQIIPNECPQCGKTNISRIRRITGYLSTLDMFNASKLAEINHRETHTK